MGQQYCMQMLYCVTLKCLLIVNINRQNGDIKMLNAWNWFELQLQFKQLHRINKVKISCSVYAKIQYWLKLPALWIDLAEQQQNDF